MKNKYHIISVYEVPEVTSSSHCIEAERAIWWVPEMAEGS